MTPKEPFFSIIVPVRYLNRYLTQELIPAVSQQTYPHFELIIVSDKKEKLPKGLPEFIKLHFAELEKGPAAKRDQGAALAQGDWLAFIDDDAYPAPTWLKNAAPYHHQKNLAALCGPGLTPPGDNLSQKASGYFWSTPLLVSPSIARRARASAKTTLDDYPSFNLLVRQKDFQKTGGFNSHFWPGEDTKLCHDLVYKLGKKIVYDPKILVFHHRRAVFKDHLAQARRYAFQRGRFVALLPKTSLRPLYFLPSLFFIFLAFSPPLIFLFELSSLCFLSIPLLGLWLLSILLYFFVLLLSSLSSAFREKSLKLFFLLFATSFITHLNHALFFIRGLFTKKASDSKY